MGFGALVPPPEALCLILCKKVLVGNKERLTEICCNIPLESSQQGDSIEIP